MAAIYLKDAYYSVSISRQFKNSLHLNGKKNYTVLRFSKWSHSRKFAKLNKVPLATFHFEIVPLSGYNDDRFTKEDTFSICEENLPKTRRLYNKLGFDRVSQIFSHTFRKGPNCSNTRN